MVAHAAQDIDQRAALLAGLDHVDVEIGKDDRLFAHGFGQALAFHHVLLELAADVGGNALGFQMGHAVQRDSQRHAGLDEIGQLIGEGGQFLEFGLALALEIKPHGGRQKRGERLCRATTGRSAAAAAAARAAAPLGTSTAMGKRPSLSICSRAADAIGDLQHACDYLARTPPGFVSKLSHRSSGTIFRLSLILTRRRGKVASESLSACNRCSGFDNSRPNH